MHFGLGLPGGFGGEARGQGVEGNGFAVPEELAVLADAKLGMTSTSGTTFMSAMGILPR